MSKEFEEWRRKVGVNSDEFTMRNCFEAGRALGRREMKGEAKEIALESARIAESIGQVIEHDTHGRDRLFARSRAANSIADAIEAIPEEV